MPEDTYMGTLGNWYNYSATFAEAEERSPWQPFHVQQGWRPDESAVSIFFGARYTQSGYRAARDLEREIRPLSDRGRSQQPPLIVMDPIVARLFVELGFDSKEKLIDWCAENARMPAREYWDDQWVQTLTFLSRSPA